jgi:hypothetical protein
MGYMSPIYRKHKEVQTVREGLINKKEKSSNQKVSICETFILSFFCHDKVIYHVRPEDRQPQIHNEIPGRLKVCSKSVVFVPSSHLLPMLKFPLTDCDVIDEWSPRSFQSALAAKQEVLTLNFYTPLLFENKFNDLFIFLFLFKLK